MRLTLWLGVRGLGVIPGSVFITDGYSVTYYQLSGL